LFLFDYFIELIGQGGYEDIKSGMKIALLAPNYNLEKALIAFVLSRFN
jgi:hypothetical protein